MNPLDKATREWLKEGSIRIAETSGNMDRDRADLWVTVNLCREAGELEPLPPPNEWFYGDPDRVWVFGDVAFTDPEED